MHKHAFELCNMIQGNKQEFYVHYYCYIGAGKSNTHFCLIQESKYEKIHTRLK